MDANVKAVPDQPSLTAVASRAGTVRETPAAARSGEAFTRAWAEARAGIGAPPQAAEVVVEPGDTLWAIVRDTLQRRHGAAPNLAPTMAMVHRVAQANGIANPDRIYPGQRITLADAVLAADRAAPVASEVARPPTAALSRENPPPAPAAAVTTAQNLRLREAAQGHPVLERTLQRAVEQRFIAAAEKPAVERRILALSRQFGFSPDDFARVALMESDGFNPRASNGRCHGIIQFCEGAQRGAGSVGLAGRAQKIVSMGVLRQLDLVERYFRDTGLDRLGGKVSLDDLYLTVLTPAARATRDPEQALNIPGQQAAALYTGGDRNTPMTRTSLLEGLRRHAEQRLGSVVAQQPGGPRARRQNLAAAVGQSSPSAAAVSGDLRPPTMPRAPEEPPA